MFPKNRINLIYRLLCLICFIVVILIVNSIKSLLVLFVFYCFFALSERSFKNIELIILTLIILGISYLFGNYSIFKIMLILDYSFYFLDTSYYVEEDETITKEEYIRFKKINKRKVGISNTIAVYLTVHLVVLFIGILVG